MMCYYMMLYAIRQVSFAYLLRYNVNIQSHRFSCDATEFACLLTLVLMLYKTCFRHDIL
jgi:hypothetical protein